MTDDLVLIDSEEESNDSSDGFDDINLESEKKQVLVGNDKTPENELANNEDFIGFGFLSEDDSEEILNPIMTCLMVTMPMEGHQTLCIRGLKIMIILSKRK